MVLRKEITSKIRDLLKQNPQGLNITAIVRSININRNTAGRYLENLMVSGQVEMRRFGMAKIYRLAKRVPLSAMLSISSELILLLDSGMRVVYANEPLLQFCGTTQKDLYGKNIEYTPVATVFDDAFDTVKKQVRAGISGKEWYGELPLKHKGIIFACRIAPAVFEEGQRGVSVLLENITGRKNAEEVLRDSETTIRALIDTPVDSILLMNPEGIILDGNTTFAQRLGMTVEELKGRCIYDLFPPDLVKSRKSQVENIMRTGKPHRYEDQRAGRWLDNSLHPILDAYGNITKIAINARDITERKQAEEKLRESEDRYRSLVEISPDPVILHKDGKIMYMNPAAFRLLGASPSDEVIGKNILDFIHPGFRNAVKKNIMKDLQGDGTPLMELTMLQIDGTPVIVEGRGVRTTINGKPAVQVAIKDITKRKQAEQALREREATARALISAPTDSILLLDADGIILDLNRTAASRLGRRREELIGLVADTVLPADVAQHRRSIISEVLRTKEAVRFEDERDGLWFDTVAYPVIDETGEVKKVAVIARDITRRQRAEKSLRQSEGKLTAMLQSITDPMSMMDENLTIIWANDSAIRYFGDGIVGMKCYEAFHQRLSPCEPSPCLTLRAFADGKMHRHETTVIDREGTRRFFDCTANVALRDEQGRPTAVLEISRDCTGLKRAEAALHKGPGEIQETGAPGARTKKAPSLN